ncbi:penicillin acylase family protein [Duganella sp. FT92W]|uniref:Penicillin acylase family protein n=1 Tax=Pseudoduganella rivuli TaxID=2666085 RepID=A0A7X2LTH8_9BURK|nr:penicillin acylase family protein [Pseudoduganella rivuli]MRV72002.1 penicillin acylase family protein [Pseudoduganella rivuli]
MRNLLLRFAALFGLLLAAAAVYFGSTWGGGLPALRGGLTVQGIGGEVRIRRDQYGIAQIASPHDNDVFFGIGYAHAQDRLWQLELQRRLAQGRLSEVLGRDTLRLDAQMRTLDLYAAARTDWEALAPEARASLTAYRAGINAFMAASTSLPIEFNVLGIRPEPWTELDSLAWSKVFALSLANNMGSEITRLLAKPYLTEARETALFGTPDRSSPVTASGPERNDGMAALHALLGQKQQLEQQLQIGGQFVGSNAWVVSGKLTDDGRAYLANDPHLGLQIPSLWYIAGLQGDHLHASGMTIVGLPVVIFGRNQDIAWGGTNMMADVQDLYFERINPANPRQYWHDGAWREFAIRRHEIRVRPDFPVALREELKPVQVEVRHTVRGPVVSDAFGLSDQPVSLRWTALDPGDTSYEAFYRLNYATGWHSFNAALRHHAAPALNFLYVDKQGNIGYLGAGKIPVRAAGQGQVPLDGGAGDSRWTGYIPFEALPRSFNPDKGYIVSANNRVVDDSYPYFISSDWAPPARANRIDQLIKSKVQQGKPLTQRDLESMQIDTVSFDAARLVAILRSTPMATERQRQAQAHVARWDGNMAAGSPAASIFMTWSRRLRTELYGELFKAPLGRERETDLLKGAYMGISHGRLADALAPGNAVWCTHDRTGPRSCDAIVRRALDTAIADLDKLAGSDMDGWAWGKIHHAVYAHRPFSDVKFAKWLFEKRVARGGGPDTVDVSNTAFREAEGYEQTFGASFRQIIGFSARDVVHRYINPTGQSGNVFSTHYDDMVQSFHAGQYLDETRRATVDELVLTPARPGSAQSPRE